MNETIAEEGLIALVPAFNEAAGITAVIEGTRRHLPVLVVDDGSSDDTAARAEAAGANVKRQPSNAGKGIALKTGFRAALALGARAVITLDADGQHDPDEIPLFLAQYAKTEADLIIGARRHRQMPIVRRCSNTLGRLLLSWAMGRKLLDNQSGYRLLNRRMMAAVLESDEAGFEFEVEMIAACVELGYRLDWVRIKTIYADETSHIKPLQHARNFMRLVGQTRRRMRR